MHSLSFSKNLDCVIEIMRGFWNLGTPRQVQVQVIDSDLLQRLASISVGWVITVAARLDLLLHILKMLL